jgi:hypothetical protein
LSASSPTAEGWHNNHHADPRSARHGHRWWEIDNTYLTIRFLAWLGLAGDVVTPTPAPKKTSACLFGELKTPRAHVIPDFCGGTSIASLIKECGG